MNKILKRLLFVLLTLMCLTGCELIEDIEDIFDPDNPTNPDNPDNGQFVDAINPSEVKWLGVNVGGWARTYSLNVKVSGSSIIYDQEGTSNWTPKQEAGVMATGNPWIITDEFDGTWVAATHEWMRDGQKVKGKRSVHGDHIKKREFGPDWVPTSGRRYGFCVSGLCRGVQRNESERTQIVFYTWP